MAEIFIDGFDKYGPVTLTNTTLLATLLTQGEWSSTFLASSGRVAAIAAGLSSTGNSIYITGGVNTGAILSFQKTLPGNFSRLIGGLRFMYGICDSRAAGISFFDTVTPQCSITFDQSTGTISLRNGDVTGTALATSSTSVSTGSIHYLEWDITYGAAASYQVWLDGVSLFSGTGNTKVTANSYANVLKLAGGASAAFTAGITGLTVDDLYLFDTTGSACNAVLLTNPRIETTFPVSDSQAQFLFGAGVIGANAAYQGSANTAAPGANRLFLRQYTATASCALASVACVPAATSATAKFKAVIYPDSGGSPNGQTLIATGNEVVGTTSGTALASIFSSPPSLVAGNSYWIGFITDTSVALQQSDASTLGVSAANTYTAGAPATCPTVTTGQVDWIIYGPITAVGTGVNWLQETPNPVIGDLSFVFSSTAGNEDLYNFGSLTSTPSVIYTVAVKGSIRKTDTGVRTVDLRTKSGTTDSGGSLTGQAPSTTYGWLHSFFTTDPNTGVAWTGSGLNAATSGPKIAS